MNATKRDMERPVRRIWTGKAITAMLPLGLLAGGCVTVNAPDKPIVINLNIKIDQEVVYRLDTKARAAIEENAGVF